MKHFLIKPNLPDIIVIAKDADEALDIWYEGTQGTEIKIKEITKAHADVKEMHGVEILND